MCSATAEARSGVLGLVVPAPGADPTMARPDRAGDPVAVVVEVVGEVDIANSDALRAELVAAAADGRGLVADLGRLTYCDASGLGALLAARAAATARGGSLHLMNVPAFFRRLLSITSLQSVLPIAGEPDGRP